MAYCKYVLLTTSTYTIAADRQEKAHKVNTRYKPFSLSARDSSMLLLGGGRGGADLTEGLHTECER